MATFAQWLLAQEDQVDAGGEATVVARLARAWKGDNGHGNTSSPAGVKRYISGRWDEEHPDEGSPTAAEMLGWLDTTLAVYRGQRTLGAVPEPSAAQQDLADLVKQLAFDVGWLRAALSMLLTDEQLAVLDAAAAQAAEEAETPDFAEMWAKADHSGADEAG